MLFDTEQWRRIVPTSPLVLLQAWNTWVHYATFHLPPEPNGFYGYNALQQIAYFTVVLVFGPLAIATGIAPSSRKLSKFIVLVGSSFDSTGLKTLRFANSYFSQARFGTVLLSVVVNVHVKSR